MQNYEKQSDNEEEIEKDLTTRSYPLAEKYKPTKKGAYKDDGVTKYKP